MKKWYKIVCVCILIGCVATAGYSYGEKKQLPVVESTALFRYADLQTVTEESQYIMVAEVSEVSDTKIKEELVAKFGDPEDPASYTDVRTYPYTPIRFDVEQWIKGGNTEEQFVYNQLGGETSTHIELPAGYVFEKGMKIVLFLCENEVGQDSWGGQGEFPIINGKVVIDSENIKYMDSEKLSTLDRTEIDESYYSDQIEGESVEAVDIEYFLEVVQDMINRTGEETIVP